MCRWQWLVAGRLPHGYTEDLMEWNVDTLKAEGHEGWVSGHHTTVFGLDVLGAMVFRWRGHYAHDNGLGGSTVLVGAGHQELIVPVG